MASRGGLSGLALAEVAAGVILVWSGISNAAIAATLKSLIGGRKPVADTGGEGVGADVTQSPQTPESETASGQEEGGGTPAENKALGRLMAAGYGWAAGDNWAYLESGWEVESGWSNIAQNGVWPGAYGIAQANPGTKYPKAGWPAAEGGSSSAVTQIAWGLAYIKDTYGSPSQVPGWSASGPVAGYVGY
jgi:hypothetical protein